MMTIQSDLQMTNKEAKLKEQVHAFFHTRFSLEKGQQHPGDKVCTIIPSTNKANMISMLK